MTALLGLPTIKNVEAFHLKRWAAVRADTTLRNRPDRVETNRFGQVIMMPPPGFSHTTRQSQIFKHLLDALPDGHAVAECAVLTEDGIKGIDVAWISKARVKRGLKSDVLTIAPEICVEVISPGNTRQEMEDKRRLYFAAGADEVWFCTKTGAMHFFLKDAPAEAVKTSARCPKMPVKVKA